MYWYALEYKVLDEPIMGYSEINHYFILNNYISINMMNLF